MDFNSFAFLTQPSDAETPGIKEFRWALRLEQEHKYRFFNFSGRWGVEYRRRDIDHNAIYQPNWRVRYQARAEKPLRGILPGVKPISVFIADEVFIQFGKAVRKNPNVFDQNRISAGFSLGLLKNVKASFSYLNIILERNNGRDFDDAHALWVVLTLENLFSQWERSSPEANRRNTPAL